MYEYEVIRSRRRTIAIEIDRSGQIKVRAPYNVGNFRIRRFVEEKSGWIEKALARINKGQSDAISSDDLPPISEADKQLLADQAKKIIPGKVSYFAGIIGVDFGRITIRAQKTRWGSCSAKGNLNFNCLLLRAPEEILDYVIVHELCHRKEMNHSKAFWAEVAKVCPDYKKHRKWLKDHGDELMSSLGV
ncbi:hypothetical protein SAMN02910292_02958 [Lachnospiraceae bacterium XBB2008]|nr:M48 family metallopeptidase [Lachnospiraceae bacterium]SCY79474.1 hypothetical protein SAMN02910292_02958 [Lachnospiraceae bacterium XBB2008]